MNLQLANPDLFRETAFIGGEWVHGEGGATITVDDPATGAVIGSVPDCSAADTHSAIAAAQAAFAPWRALSAGRAAPFWNAGMRW